MGRIIYHKRKDDEVPSKPWPAQVLCNQTGDDVWVAFPWTRVRCKKCRVIMKKVKP